MRRKTFMLSLTLVFAIFLCLLPKLDTKAEDFNSEESISELSDEYQEIETTETEFLSETSGLSESDNISSLGVSVSNALQEKNTKTEESEKSIFTLADNPNTRVSGTLTEALPQIGYIFSVTDSNRFLLARLTSSNSNYYALLCKIDENGNLIQTNVRGSSGKLIQQNGLPIGKYVFIIYSSDKTYGQNYTFDINVTNPSANLSNVIYVSRDLSVFIFQTKAGDVYSNGTLVGNPGKSSDLKWTYSYEYRWGSGYEQRTHSVFNVKVKSIYDKPVSYVTKYASSKCALLIYCDVGTAFSYMYSYYQSGVNHIYKSSGTDVSGRITPRELDAADFYGENTQVLVYDVLTGKVIDFYSKNLNEFYNKGYYPLPTQGPCEL